MSKVCFNTQNKCGLTNSVTNESSIFFILLKLHKANTNLVITLPIWPDYIEKIHTKKKYVLNLANNKPYNIFSSDY